MTQRDESDWFAHPRSASLFFITNRFKADYRKNSTHEQIKPVQIHLPQRGSPRRGHTLGLRDDFRILDQSAQITTLSTIVSTLTSFLGAIGAISLLVGGIGIMNIMLVSVTERTREIGVRKALGAKAGAIRAQFLIEALVVTLIAGALGVAGGVGLSFVIGQVQASSVIAAVGVSVLIGVVFGLYPAWRASLLAPVEALRYE